MHCVAIAANTALVAESFCKSRAEYNAHVLNGVVIVHPSISLAFHGQIESAVAGTQREHVVKKAATGIDF